MASEAKTASPTATDADLARVLTRKGRARGSQRRDPTIARENARLRKWDELEEQIDRDERNEKDGRHYAQALVQHARQQRAAREARAREAGEKEFGGRRSSFVAVYHGEAARARTPSCEPIKGDDVQHVPESLKKNPTIDKE